LGGKPIRPANKKSPHFRGVGQFFIFQLWNAC